MEIAEFLLARIAEDQERATHVQGQLDSYAAWIDPEPWRLSWQDEYDLLCIDPRRALAECEAKRRIVELCQHAEAIVGTAQWWMRWPVLCALALPYADHPDFDPDWKV